MRSSRRPGSSCDRLPVRREDQAGPGRRRSALEGRLTADVVVVGAGLTGLWTAYYLAERDPSLAVVVLEAGARRVRRERCATVAGARRCSPPRPRRWRAGTASRRPPHCGPPCGRPCARSAGCARPRASTAASAVGGTLALARTPVQLARARAEAAEARRWGRRGRAAGRRGGTRAAGRQRRARRHLDTPTARGSSRWRWSAALADAVEARGVTILEGLRVDGHRTRVACAPTRGTGTGAPRAASHRGVDRHPARHPPGGGPGLLADDRHRTARREPPGTPSVCAAPRRSPTSGT